MNSSLPKKLLGDICELQSGGTPSTKNEEYWTGKIPWITGGDINSNQIKTIRRKITEKAINSSSTYLVPKGTILLVTRTGVGKIAFAPFDIAISQDITAVSCKDGIITNSFLFYYLQNRLQDLKYLNQGTSINGILRKDLKELLIRIPSISEQKKIVEILSTWDRAIERTERLVGSKKRHRGQTLNKLMSETRGEKTNLDKICTFQSGGTPSTKNDDFWQGSIPWITGGDIEKKSVTSIRKHITKQAIENSSTHLAPKDTILLVTRTGVGKIAFTDFDIAISQDITAIYPSEKTIDNHFLFWSLYFSKGKLENLNQGTSINGILRKDLGNLKIKIPPLQEQKKIANLLGTIDNEIQLLEQELKRLKKQKKGLLQKLLTGEVRVKP